MNAATHADGKLTITIDGTVTVFDVKTAPKWINAYTDEGSQVVVNFTRHKEESLASIGRRYGAGYVHAHVLRVNA